MLELNDLPESVKAEVERALAGNEVAVTRSGQPAGRLTGTAVPPPPVRERRPVIFGLGLGSITMHPSFWDEEDMGDWLGGPENPV